MIAADKIIRSTKLVPSTYPNQSRDFALLCRLFDATFNTNRFNAQEIRYINDAANINDNLLLLLADKLGIKNEDAEQLKDNELRLILQCLPKMMKYKGSLTAIEQLVGLYFKIYHLSGDFKISLGQDGQTIQGNMVTDKTVIIALETMAKSTKLIEIMSKYLLPPGYSFFIYFYNKNNKDSIMEYEESAHMLFRSNSLANKIDAVIPNFINDVYFTAMSCKLEDLPTSISAVDTEILSGFNIDLNDDYFFGFTTLENLNRILTNMQSAQKYNPEKKYKNLDVYYNGSGDNKKYYAYLVEKETKDEVLQYSEKLISSGALAIDTDQNKVYILEMPAAQWHELNNLGCYDELPETTKDSPNLWDMVCVIDEPSPYLIQTDGTNYTYTKLNNQSTSQSLPSTDSHSVNDLVFVFDLGKYYVLLQKDKGKKQWQECNEGPVMSTKGLLDKYTPINNTVCWYSGGNYYVYMKNSKGENAWVPYTKQLYYMQLIKLGGTQ